MYNDNKCQKCCDYIKQIEHYEELLKERNFRIMDLKEQLSERTELLALVDEVKVVLEECKSIYYRL